MISIVTLALLAQVARPTLNTQTGVTINTNQIVTGTKSFSATVKSTVGSGSNAFEVLTAGARTRVGPATNSYFYQNGSSQIETPATLKVAGLATTGTVSFSAISATTGTFSGAISATTGTFTGAVSATSFTSSGGVAVGGALTTATTGSFSGAVAVGSLVSTGGVAAGGALTTATTGAFSGAVSVASLTSSGALSGTSLALSAGITGATTGSFSGAVSVGSLSSSGVAVGGALSTATTGSFSGQVNVGSLVSAGAISGTSHAMTGALTGATTGSFSGNLAAGSLTSSGGLAAGGAISGATTGAFSGAITSSVGSGSNAFAISTQGARVGIGPAASSYFFENGSARIETPNHLIINSGAINLFNTGLIQAAGINISQVGGYAQYTTQSVAPILILGANTDGSTAVGVAVKNSNAFATEGAMLFTGYNSGTTQEFALDWRGMLQLNKQGRSEPTCDSNTYHRGLFSYKAGAGGVADSVRICIKNSSDVYSWQSLYTGT